MSASIADVRLVELPNHLSAGGELVVMEGGQQLPFQIARVFLVRSPAATTRGRHAHKRCSQFMLSSGGRVQVTCDDGREVAQFMLDRVHVGLLVPPGIWASQLYMDESALVVLCDRLYEADDYIRDYEQFKQYRAQTRA